jgi:hypothetical protein
MCRISPSPCPSVCPSVRLSVRPSVRPSVSLSVCLSVRPSVCLPACLPACPPARPSVRVPVRPSVRLSVCLSVCDTESANRIFVRSPRNSARKFFRKSRRAKASFMKIGSVKDTVYQSVYINFYPYPPHFLNDLGVSRCLESTLNAIKHSRVSRKTRRYKRGY